MSNFLKKILFKSTKSKQDLRQAFEVKSVSEDTVQTKYKKEYAFSSDEVGRELNSLWQNWNGASTESASDILESTTCFVELLEKFVCAYSSTQIEQVNQLAPSIDDQLDTITTPTNYMATGGHPTLFVLQLVTHLSDVLAFEPHREHDGADSCTANGAGTLPPKDKVGFSGEIEHTSTAVEDSGGGRMSAGAEFNWSKLFSGPVCTVPTGDEEAVEQRHQSRSTARSGFLRSLQSLCTAACWSHNCAVLQSSLGKEFASFCLRLIAALSAQLSAAYNDWAAAVRSGSASGLVLPHLEQSVDFAASCLIHAVQLVSRASAEGAPAAQREFCDLLPAQPWSVSDLSRICTAQPDVSPQPVSSKSSAMRGDSGAGAALPDSTALSKSFADAGALRTAIDLLKTVHGIAQSATADVFTDSRCPQFLSRLCRTLLALQAETLWLLNALLVAHPREAERCHAANYFLVCNNLLVSHPVDDLLGADEGTLERLVVRRGLLCLRLNGVLSGHSNSDPAREGPLRDSSSALELPAICEFLFWVSQRFDAAGRYSTELAAMLAGGSAADKVGMSVAFQRRFSPKSRLVFDLWPWRLAGEADDVDFAVTLSDSSAHYHLLAGEATQHLKADALHRMAGYTVWDALLVELVGSTAFSSRSAEGKSTARSAQAAGHARKNTRRNIHFVFLVFQQLFDEKSCSFSAVVSAKTQPTLSVSAQQSSVPLAQLKFSEYISQLFKMAEPEMVFDILAELDLFRVLWGRMFLRGGPDLAQELPFRRDSAAAAYNDVVVTGASEGNAVSVRWSAANCERGVRNYVWALLYDSVLDFFNGLAVYSLYFQAGASSRGAVGSSSSFLAFEDVADMLVDMLLHSSSAPPDDAVRSTVSYQALLLLHNLSEAASSLGDSEKTVLRRRIVGKLLDLAEEKLCQLSTSGTSADSTGSTGQSDFRWLECEAAVSLVVCLTSMSATGNTDWADILAALPSEGFLRPATASADFSDSADLSSSSHSTSDQPVSPRQHHSDRKDGSLEIFSPQSSEKAPPSAGVSSLAKGRIQVILLLLREPRTRAAGLHLLSDVITLCASASLSLVVDTASSAQHSRRAMDSRKLNRAVVSEVYRQLVSLLSQCSQLPEACNGLRVAVELLELQTWLLRSGRFVILRTLLQDIFRPHIHDFLTASATCVKGFSEKNKRSLLFPVQQAEGAVPHDIGPLMKHVLALLTGVLAGDEASKAELGLASQHSKESHSEFMGHLFGNFRNVDKIKKLSASSASSSAHGSPAAPAAKSTSYVAGVARGAATFDSLKELIVAAEPSPSRETIVVLFEMLLDGHCLLAGDTGSRPLFSSDVDRPKIRNAHVVPDLFELVVHCSPEVQTFVLVSFHRLVTGRASLVNLNVCSLCKPRVIDLALDLFAHLSDEVQAHNVALIQSLGQHGISVAMLKHLFRVLQSRGECRPAHSWRVIQALQGMITEEDGPRQTFVFEGRTSGLRLPPISRWPAQKAYSFCSWLKIEAPKAGAARLSVRSGAEGAAVREVSVYAPHIVCLRSASGAGMEFYLRPSKIPGMFAVVLKITSESGETSVLSPELRGMKVAEGRWHFLGFSVSCASFYSKAEACIQLDDHFARQPVSSGKLPDHILEPLIGDCPDSMRAEGHNSTMRGQMGAFYFFATSLSEGQFRSIRALGPDYIYNFEPFSALYQVAAGSSSAGSGAKKQQQRVDPVLSILDGSLTPHIILAHNPVVWKGDYFLDNTPLCNEVRWKVPSSAPSSAATDSSLHDGPGYCKMHALRLKGTYRSMTQDVRLALNSLGGIKTVFPLFAQLDQHRIVPGEPSSSGTSAVDTRHDPHFLPSVLQLLVSLLENNLENQQIFLRIHGFGVISHLLERVSPEHFSSLTLDRLVELFHKLDSHPPLQEAFLGQLLCNFKLWVFTPLPTQLRLFSMLGELVALNAHFFVEALSFQRLADLLYLLYDYEVPAIDRTDDWAVAAAASAAAVSAVVPSLSQAGGPAMSFSASSGLARSGSSRDLAGSVSAPGVAPAARRILKDTIYSSDVWTRVGTGEVVGVKLKGAELLQVRSMIFSLLSSIVHSNRAFLPEDVQALVLYLVQTGSAVSKAEILTFLLTLLSNEENTFLVPQMLLGFAIGNAVSLINGLYDHESAHVRLLALSLFCKMLVLSLDYKLLPDIPRASRYYNKVLARTPGAEPVPSAETADSADASAPPPSRDAGAKSGESATFSDTFEALGVGPQSLLSTLVFVQERLLRSQSRDSSASRQLQNKVTALALQLTMCGESCAYLQPVISEAFAVDRGTGDVTHSRLAELDAGLDLQFGEFQSHRLPSATLCVPMAFLALLNFVASEHVTVDLRLAVVLNLKTVISRSVGNCDRLLGLGRWQEHLLAVISSEAARRRAVPGESSADLGSDKQLGKSRAVDDVCKWIMCEIQLTAMRVGRSTDALSISRLGSSTKELTRPEVVRCITRGDRHLGGLVLRGTVLSVVTCLSSDPAAALDVGLAVLEKSARVLVEERRTLRQSSDEGGKAKVATDLMQDHCEKMLHLNAWLAAASATELVDALEWPSPAEPAARASLSTIAELLAELLGPASGSGRAAAWLLEEKTFRVQAGGSAVSALLPTKLMQSSYAPPLMKLGVSASQRVPLSHSPGGLWWILVRLYCTLHLATETADSDASPVTGALRDLLDTAEEYPEAFRREALYVLALLSEALRTSSSEARRRSEQWVVATVELVVELATAVKNPLLAAVADGSYALSFSALSARDRPSVSCSEGSNSLDAGSAQSTVDPDAIDEAESTPSPGYSVLITSLVPLLDLPADDEIAADLWTSLMQSHLRAAQSADRQLMEHRLAELGAQSVAPSIESESRSRLASKSRQQSIGTLVLDDCFARSQMWRSTCVEQHSARLREWVRSLDAQNRRYDSKWTRIFTELANERGPWGYSASGDQQQEVFWMLDACETDLHIKMRMRRNQAGTRHLIATQRSFGRHSYSADSSIDSLPADRSVSDSDPLGSGGGGGLQGIYRDLKRFKKKQIANMPFSQQRPQQTDGGELDKRAESSDEETSDSDSNDADGLAGAGSVDQPGADPDKVLFSAAAEVITSATNSSGGHTLGKIEVTKGRVAFVRQNEAEGFDFANKTGNSEFMWACHSYPSSTWPGEELHAACERLYQMRPVAVELFFTSRISVLVNLFETKSAKRLLRVVRTRLRAPHLNLSMAGRPRDIIARPVLSNQTLTQAWVHHRITNFEYLMRLNVVAGRTFNDLAQYPVFPWVLADYSSPRIDLRDPKCFRDFRWPMGAQLDEQRRILTEKYEASASLMDDEVLPYHTGSHYSTAAMVIWYLLRMEPFTSYHVWLQDGKFDRPDRLFHSVASTYRGCTTNPQDVKELIPEFFYCPDFMENVNDISFGARQNGKVIDNVEMPAWCKDASDFVRINREALESDYVSAHLHHWIDLVFGYKQRPPHLSGGSEAAVGACNVFVHLTYPDAVNLEDIRATDAQLYERTVRQIDNYGQTPVQLFDRAHPERLPIDRVDIIWPIASVVTGVDTVPRTTATQLDKPAKVLCYGDFRVSSSPVLLVAVCPGVDKMVVVDSTRVIGYHMFQARQADIVPPFAVKIDKTALAVSSAHSSRGGRKVNSYLSSNAHAKEKLAGVPFASQGVLSQQSQQTSGARVSATALSDREYELIGTPANRASFLRDEHQSRLKSVENDRRLQQSKSMALTPGAGRADESRSKKTKSSGSSSTSSPPPPPLAAASTIQSGSSLASQLADHKAAGAATRIERRERVDEHLSCNLFALLPDSKLLFSCAHWDNSFKVTAVDTGRLVQSVSHHREVVTCLALASDFGRHWLVTGSKDCIVIVWDLAPEREAEPIDSTPLHILYGHDDCVNCLAVNAELDLVVSGSDDGTVIIHTLRDGSYLRSVLIGISQTMYAKAVAAGGAGGGKRLDSFGTGSKPGSPASSRSGRPASDPQIYKRRVHLVAVTREGYIVTYSGDGNLLSTHTMNGRYVKMVDAKERLHAMCVSDDGKTLLTGGERCLVVVRWVNNLTLANNGPRKDLDAVIDGSHEPEHAPFASPIRSLCLTGQERHLIVGLESGHIRVLAQDSEYLRRKLHRKLMEIGILTF